MRLEGKTALVTGGASGFGAGIARKFIAEGARVLIADIDAAAVEAMAGVLGAGHVVADVGDDAGVEHMAMAALGAFGHLDILVNNAGVTHLPAALEDIAEPEFDRILRVNAKSVYLTARHLVPAMKGRGTGAILNVASTAGLSPRPRLAWYNASKGWMITATKSMAVELAAFGVRVNALCPVAGETPLLKSFLGEDTPEMRAKFLATIPLGRFSTPQDLGNAAAFLCSDEASMLTGVALEVDGGAAYERQGDPRGQARCLRRALGAAHRRRLQRQRAGGEAAMMRPGPRNLITDVPGILVGNASDARLKSGVTVLTADAPFVAAVDVRGGAPGTRETDLLAAGRIVAAVDALVLSGGSAFGLDAASAVADRLRSQGRGFRAGHTRVPIVPAAILFDLANGGDKAWGENPYRALGAAAFEAAAEDFGLGSEGAGIGAMTATLMGGLGSASLVTEEGATVGALAAVNGFGSVCVPGSRAFWAGAFEIGDEFGGLGPAALRAPPFTPRPMKPGPGDPPLNTTLAIVATDAVLTKAQAHRMAEVAQSGMARAIHPAHTLFDGDLVFAVSTEARPLAAPPALTEVVLGHAAALCLARAIARAVHAATPAPGNLLPCWVEGGGD